MHQLISKMTNILINLGIAHILNQNREKNVLVTIEKNVGVPVCRILIVQILLPAALMGVEIHVCYMGRYRISQKGQKNQVLQYHVQNFINLMIAATPLMNAKILVNLAMPVLIILCAVLMVVATFVFTDM